MEISGSEALYYGVGSAVLRSLLMAFREEALVRTLRFIRLGRHRVGRASASAWSSRASRGSQFARRMVWETEAAAVHVIIWLGP